MSLKDSVLAAVSPAKDRSEPWRFFEAMKVEKRGARKSGSEVSHADDRVLSSQVCLCIFSYHLTPLVVLSRSSSVYWMTSKI